MNSAALTYFATPERSDFDELLRQKAVFENLPQLAFFLDTVPTIYLILNDNRQIVFANKQALQTLKFKKVDDLLGLRQGEAINCIHAKEMEAGCGTSEACRMCGAVNATLSSLNNIADVQECRISANDNLMNYDFRVTSNPYILNGEKFVILSLVDIGDEKRRLALENIFFHDVLNTASGIKGISELIMDHPEEIDEFKDILNQSSNQLVSEIVAQRNLINAENNDLKAKITKLNSTSVIRFIIDLYTIHQTSTNKIEYNGDSSDNIDFESDESLLLRILGNMTKNALEASDIGQVVTVSCKAVDGKVVFAVHNPNFMPRDVQLQVFQRSFSTKGEGRGLGTYSMKLLSEKYLKGKVYFTSNKDNGTTFYTEFPVVFSE